MPTLTAIKLLLIAAIISCLPAKSQENTVLAENALELPGKLLNNLHFKAQKLQSQVDAQTIRYLKKLERQEEKLRKKLAKKDSLAAAELFGNVKERYARLTAQMQQGVPVDKLDNFYSPHFDSVSTALGFLQQYQGANQKIQTALSSYQQLQQHLSSAQQIKKYLQQRQKLLQSRLQDFGMIKELQEFKKQAYYYKAQIDEYKKLLNDPSAMERKLIQLASKTSLFKDFFSKYSQLATLFQLQVEPGSFAGLQGLQTRAQTQQLLQQQMGGAGMNVQQAVQSSIANAQSQLSQLKNKLAGMGGGNSEDEMPDFKPNQQKTKRFLDRFEFGSNLQTSRTTNYFPATADIGLSVGYKLNDKSIIGIGGSYKLGLGTGWNRMALTHQGIGLRSFAELKLKGSFWIAGGGELNYRSQFNDLTIFKNYNAWQQSALLGISKKYSVGKKFKGNAQLLYDFLHRKQIPVAQPVIFRLGYTLK